jgi:hypothetical protein
MAKSGVDPDVTLWETEERPIGVSVPLLLSKRLDELVKLAGQTGARLYRKDIVAALILAAPEDPEELHQLFLDYRKAKARAAEVGGDTDAEILQLEPQKPGRRPRTSSG